MFWFYFIPFKTVKFLFFCFSLNACKRTRMWISFRFPFSNLFFKFFFFFFQISLCCGKTKKGILKTSFTVCLQLVAELLFNAVHSFVRSVNKTLLVEQIFVNQLYTFCNWCNRFYSMRNISKEKNNRKEKNVFLLNSCTCTCIQGFMLLVYVFSLSISLLSSMCVCSLAFTSFSALVAVSKSIHSTQHKVQVFYKALKTTVFPCMLYSILLFFFLFSVL